MAAAHLHEDHDEDDDFLADVDDDDSSDAPAPAAPRPHRLSVHFGVDGERGAGSTGQRDMKPLQGHTGHGGTGSLDLLSLFVADVQRYPLLSREQELAIARQVRAGDATPPRACGCCVTAKHALFNHNLRLVIALASANRRFQRAALDILDLMSAGAEGLWHAIDLYQPEMGFTFSTYATLWIRQRIGREFDNMSDALRVPIHLRDKLRRVERVRLAYLALHDGHEPTDDDLLDAGARVDDLRTVRRMQRETGNGEALGEPTLHFSQITPRGQAHKLGGGGSPEDHQHAGGRGSEPSYLELIADPSVDVEATALAAVEWDRLRGWLASLLSDRELLVLTLRYGLDGGVPQTLLDIGNRFNVSRERIRQVEAHALERLRTAMLADDGEAVS
ncbi:MAG: sigma-70 family RNA polymerase sigma factor [Ktedonobacterales bacterium]|nr:sigma-70 family RNA polymerase sigma factor [Ktedonobacterales bacterium]